MTEKVTIHVDNGGYSFEVTDGSIIITDGYFGYSEHKMTLNGKVTPQNLRMIATMFMNAASKLDLDARRKRL